MPIMAILQRKEQDFDPTGLAAARYQKWLRTPAVEREDEGDTLLEDWECKFLKKRFFRGQGRAPVLGLPRRGRAFERGADVRGDAIRCDVGGRVVRRPNSTAMLAASVIKDMWRKRQATNLLANLTDCRAVLSRSSEGHTTRKKEVKTTFGARLGVQF